MALTRMISVAVLFSLFLSFPAVAVDNSATPKIAGLPADVQYPFMAKVTGNDVYVRSGKGTAYYACGKVNLDDQVTVVGEAFGWAEIIPPEGSYSWIHKNYVDVEDDQPTVGVLTGDNVRVWAGSDNIEPMRSSSMQTKLNTGEIIELFADQPADGDYYKIKPPAGAKLTINCALLEYVGPAASPKPVAIPPRTAAEKPVDLPASTETEAPVFGNLTEEKAPTETQAEPADEPDAAQDAEKAEPSKPEAEDSENLKACYALATKIDQELQKPLAEQNYDSIKQAVEAIKGDTTDSKAVTYAQILLERIVRYELAISVINTLKQQDESLATAKEKIEKARQAELKSVHRDADFIYTGVLKVSHVYTKKTGRKRYLLQGPDGKILCYAVPTTEKVAGQFEALLGKRVGVQGTVSSDTKSLVTLISATGVEPI
ncbi:MAG: SH3 domain-containing protein [Anaerohalosphaeraceae bacterium]